MRKIINLIIVFLIFVILNHGSVYAINPHDDDNSKCSKQFRVDYKPIIKRKINAIFYEAINCEAGNKVMLFGTFHTSDPDILENIAYVYPYLKANEEAWFEVDLLDSNAQSAAQMMLIPSEKSGLMSQLPPAQFKKLLMLFKRKNPDINSAIINRYKPWAAAIALEMLEVEIDGEVMDDILQKFATTNAIKVKALEKAQEQLSIFNDLTKSEQISMLNSAINNYKKMVRFSKQLINAYKAGNLSQIQQIANHSFAFGDEKLNAKLKLKLIDERNLKMAEKLLKAATNNDLFVAVGALHLSGETGLLQQFERAGYLIYPIKN
jgi:uncharacterized protein